MEEILKQIYTIVMGCITLATIIFSVISLFRTNKNKSSIEEKLVQANETIDGDAKEIENLSKINTLLEEVIPNAIIEAEKVGLSTGPVKKMYCLSIILLRCNDIGLNYNDFVSLIDNEVEKLIGFSKKVNSDDTSNN